MKLYLPLTELEGIIIVFEFIIKMLEPDTPNLDSPVMNHTQEHVTTCNSSSLHEVKNPDETCLPIYQFTIVMVSDFLIPQLTNVHTMTCGACYLWFWLYL